MCSITIFEQDEKIYITMNRDEAITRDIELPPRRYNDLIYPKDLQGNGTWMCMSEKGEVACIMNRYDMLGFESEKSRGEIPIKVIQGEDIKKMDLKEYSPFTLVVIKDKIYQYDYDGTDLKESEYDLNEKMFFTSSSYKLKEVVLFRQERFQKWLEAKPYRGSIPKIHLDQPAGKEEYSILMKRNESVTKSITQAVIDKEAGKMEVNYYYDPNTCFKRQSFTYELIS